MLAHLLAGSTVMHKEFGRLVQIKFYQRSAGWGEFDDLLLFFEKDGAEVKCGLSIKTDNQLTRSGASPELVRGAWHVFSKTDKEGLDPERDFLGLISTRQNHHVSKAFKEILRLAAEQSPYDLEHHIAQSEGRLKRQLHDSFAPSDAKTCEPSARPGDLLKRFVFLEYDFGDPQSTDEGLAIDLCRTVLAAGPTDKAGDLWKELRELAEKCRHGGGSYNLPELVAKLRTKFSLKEHPNFALHWSQIACVTSLNLAAVRDRIAHIQLPRSNLVTTLTDSLGRTRVVVLHGVSGTGKSALAGRLTKDSSAKGAVCVFLRAGGLESEETQRWIREGDPKLLFSSAHSSRALLVIDDVGTCRSEESWIAVIALLRGCAFDQTDDPWRVVFTCRTEELEAFLSQLAQRSPKTLAHAEFVQVDPLAKNEVLQVISDFPRLAPLTGRPRVLDVLRNAKILEIVVARLRAASLRGAEHWVSESSVAEWWWKEVILEGNSTGQRGHLLIEFASQLAAKARTELTSGLFPNELSTINGLIHDGILAETEGRIRFSHDLYSDWSRARALVEMGPDARMSLPNYVELLQWHHAIRLFGVHLLETPSQHNLWLALIEGLKNHVSNCLLIRDLLVEAAIFAGEPLETLESIWHDLAGNDGELLERFLVRFEHTATIPDPRILSATNAEDPAVLAQLAAMYRLPSAPLWPPVLSFIERHIEEMTLIAPVACARIAKLWLELVVEGSAQPAASIAVRVAQIVVKSELSRRNRVEQGGAKIVYGALLAAARQLPDEVSDLVLKLAGRRRWEVTDLPLETVDPRFLGKWETYHDWIAPDDFVDDPPQSWPDGPIASTPHDFQQVLLDSSSVKPLLDQRPEVLAEALLAVLIDWPKRWPRSPHGPAAEHYGLKYVENDFPPRYWKTPFLLFLRRHWEYGLKCLIKLINFATDRACELLQFEFSVRPSLEIELNGEKTTWLGDHRFFSWHRYPLITIHIIGSALMALEKWLYEELEAERPVDGAIETIFQESRSLAFVGVLLTVGKRFPALLLGPLRSLLSVPDLYDFDQLMSMQHNVNGPTVGEAEWEREATRQWEKMEHRRLSLHHLCLQKLLTDPKWQDSFSEIRRVWLSKAESASDNDERVLWLRWAAKFDPANLSLQNSEGSSYFAFALPENLRDQAAEDLVAKRQVLFGAPMQCRNWIKEQRDFNSEELERLWANLQNLAEWDEASLLRNDDGDFFRLADAVCGYIGVLIVLHLDWLREYPDRLQWCCNRLLQIVENLQCRPYDSEDDPMDFRCDDFAAQAIVQLWAENQNSTEIRNAVAKLALSFRYKTVALLCTEAAKLRDRLGRSWFDLESLLLHWSAARLLRDREEHKQEKTFNFANWEAQWIPPFIEGKMPNPPSTWQDITVPELRPGRRTNLERDVKPYWPDVNIGFLLEIYGWIPSLDEASSNEERTRWIRIGVELLRAIRRRFEIPLEDEQHFDGVPGRTDLAAFGFIARILVGLREDEEPEQLWIPILKVGPKARYWLQTFLTQFLIVGFGLETDSSRFVKYWQKMMEFALSDRNWVPCNSWLANESWQHLFGFDSTILPAWTEDYAGVVERVKSYYWRWLEQLSRQSAHRASGIIPFLRFLRSDAARSIVCEALKQMEHYFAQASEHFWRDRDDRRALSNFVGFLWSNYYEQHIRSSTDMLRVFRFLVAKLAAHQEPLALQIIASIGGGSG
jgi:hypothetical protein